MKILVADPIDKVGINLLQAYTEVDVNLGLKPEELMSIIGNYEALVVRSETKVTAPIVKAGRKLRVIGRAGVGVDNIDVEAATNEGIVVVIAPTGNIISAAEHTIALMLSLARHIPQANDKLKSGVWQKANFMGIQLRGKTLGVMGLGNVGSGVARRAQGLEMRVIAYDPYISQEHADNLRVGLVTLEELLRESDFITLHLPLTQATKGLIGKKELDMVKPTVRIINCARGGMIDEEALFQAIEQGKVAGAAVDVFSVEPACDNILCKSDKVIVTPHLAASTAEAQVMVAEDIAEQVITVLNGKPARYAVNVPLILGDHVPVLAPFMNVGSIVGKLASQLVEGQMSVIQIKYDGEIANYDTTALKASVMGGLLEGISEERVNIVNASIVAAQRGLKVVEEKRTVCENYASLLTLEVATSTGVTTVAGTVLRGEPYIVRIDEYWINIQPTGGCFLLSDHLDRPGLIGSVGVVAGNADINISSMQVSRLKPRGQALMILGLDEPFSEEQMQQVMAIPGIYTAKLVRL